MLRYMFQIEVKSNLSSLSLKSSFEADDATHWSRENIDAILQTMFFKYNSLNENAWIPIKFH